jgi:hypothetical protein
MKGLMNDQMKEAMLEQCYLNTVMLSYAWIQF